MSQKRLKKRKQRQKVVGTVIVLLIVYLFLKPTINIISGGLKTTLPSEELLVESINGEGFFIKDEKVLVSDVKGALNKSVKDGERVSAGSEIADIDNLEDSSSLEREIVEIEQAISSLEKSGTEIKKNESSAKDVEDLKQEKIKEIQKKIKNKDYANINIDKEELSVYGQAEGGEGYSSSLGSKTIETLKSRRDKIKKEIKENNVKYYAENAGIVSYDIDNYEDVFVPEDFKDYNYKKLAGINFDRLMDSQDDKDQSKDKISEGEAIYKILDDFEWYLAMKIDEIGSLKGLDPNNTVGVKLGGENQEIRGDIVEINDSKDSAVIILKFDTMMHKYYNKRVTMVELIKSKVNSLKIPKKSIIEKDGQDGVYIKNKGGIVEFRAVFKIKEIDDYAYIQRGDSNSDVHVGSGSEPIKTITLFDEVILSPRGVKEGDILD